MKTPLLNKWMPDIFMAKLVPLTERYMPSHIFYIAPSPNMVAIEAAEKILKTCKKYKLPVSRVILPPEPGIHIDFVHPNNEDVVGYITISNDGFMLVSYDDMSLENSEAMNVWDFPTTEEKIEEAVDCMFKFIYEGIYVKTTRGNREIKKAERDKDRKLTRTL